MRVCVYRQPRVWTGKDNSGFVCPPCSWLNTSGCCCHKSRPRPNTRWKPAYPLRCPRLQHDLSAHGPRHQVNPIAPLNRYLINIVIKLGLRETCRKRTKTHEAEISWFSLNAVSLKTIVPTFPTMQSSSALEEEGGKYKTCLDHRKSEYLKRNKHNGRNIMAHLYAAPQLKHFILNNCFAKQMFRLLTTAQVTSLILKLK